MSFFGSIGFIMKDSGLAEVLSTVYGENTVKNILTGHQYNRALRAHTLILLALVKRIYRRLEKKNKEFQENIDFLQNVLIIEPADVQELTSDKTFIATTNSFEKEFDDIELLNPTCKLWIQYCRMVFIVNDFIYAEKCGDWELHLKTIERMIPFFHATGHFPYAKSAQIYYNDMKDLKDKMNDEEFHNFTTNGYWTSRRSDRFYSGIFTDQTIEQTLMRLCKLEGGLFKRGVTESVAYQWIRDFIFTKDIIQGMEKFTHLTFDKNYQHKDSTDGRLTADLKSLQQIEAFFEQYDPFPDSISVLMNIANGVTAKEDCNCHKAFEEGKIIMDDVSNTYVKDLKLKRSRLVKTIASSNSKILLNKKEIEIDPEILFHRICVLKKSNDEMNNYLKWELFPFPPAFFNTYEMHKCKTDFFECFEKLFVNVRDPVRTYYVIDGGFLIHKVKWTKGQLFSSIIKSYIKFIHDHFSQNAVVVFEGFENISTKQSEKQRRVKYEPSRDILFFENMALQISQDQFLLNATNKMRVVNLLKNSLAEVGIRSVCCSSDAERTIVKTAIEIASDANRQVVIVSEDIDILVLMTALTPPELEILLLKPAKTKKPEEVYSSKSINYWPSVSEHILVLHALTGSETTSAPFNQGKKKFLTNFEKSPQLVKHAAAFQNPDLSVDKLLQHGCHLLLAMYNAPQTYRNTAEGDDNLIVVNTELYRYKMYINAVTSNKKVDLAKIMPTIDAITLHLKRVYMQVQEWLYGNTLDPVDWGWELKNNVYVPIRMTKPPGPPSILELIFCSCKNDCTNTCGCRKHGLVCTIACQHCAGFNCSNTEKYNEIKDLFDDVQDDIQD
ncbi:hypothetical protein TKK_0000187 [Trichogramma kaykai]